MYEFKINFDAHPKAKRVLTPVKIGDNYTLNDMMKCEQQELLVVLSMKFEDTADKRFAAWYFKFMDLNDLSKQKRADIKINYSGYEIQVDPKENYFATCSNCNNLVHLWELKELIDPKFQPKNEEDVATPYRTIELEGNVLGLCFFYNYSTLNLVTLA